MSKKCEFVKEGGESCEAWAMSEGDYCYLHNPDISDEAKREAQAKGGKANKIFILDPQPPLDTETAKGVVNLLGDTINKVRAGTLDLKIANCIGYLSGHLIKAIETAELERRVDFLESRLRGRN